MTHETGIVKIPLLLNSHLSNRKPMPWKTMVRLTARKRKSLRLPKLERLKLPTVSKKTLKMKRWPEQKTQQGLLRPKPKMKCPTLAVKI